MVLPKGLKMTSSPYKDLPESAFWRNAVAEKGVFGFSDLWKSPWVLPKNAVFSTYGSCFAQHFSRALLARKMKWLDAEPVPSRAPKDLALKYNYGVFSSRTGNIYTAAQLLNWARLAIKEDRISSVELWMDSEGRVHDLLRSRIEPNGFDSEASALLSVESTRRAFSRSVLESDVFVFTLGMTEGWVNKASGRSYSTCPGTAVGTFDPENHEFKNYTYPEIKSDLEAAFDMLRSLNPELKILLTVSPVPLVASASGDHVMVATQYSKSVLRAVAGDLANAFDYIDYFPSYEIISAPPTRATFFAPDMRSVVQSGVDLVMSHFFKGADFSAPPKTPREDKALAIEAREEVKMVSDELVCEEILLERFNEH